MAAHWRETGCMRTLEWSSWVALQNCNAGDEIARHAGLYRIRARGDVLLAYVGQTGRSLRERLAALRAVYGREIPYRDPHTCGPALWAWLQDRQIRLQASVCPIPGATAERKALETVAIAEHRQRHRASPRWNFGRMPPGFRMSTANNARLAAAGRRFRGGRTEENLACHIPGVPPQGELNPEVQDARWCGHRWSPWLPLEPAEIRKVAASTGLYRIRGPADGLVYIGEGNVRTRLMAHAKKLHDRTDQGRILLASAPLEFSTVLQHAWLPHHRLELETDLIAAHTLALSAPPRAQFIG
jgi:hypothetical protein